MQHILTSRKLCLQCTSGTAGQNFLGKMSQEDFIGEERQKKSVVQVPQLRKGVSSALGPAHDDQPSICRLRCCM